MKSRTLKAAVAALALAGAMASSSAFADGICIDPNGGRCATSFSLVDWFASLFSGAADFGAALDPNG